MAKRFTDTNKYRSPFFRGLEGPYKLFWDYLYHDCNHAGIWIVDVEIAQVYLGRDMPISKEKALKFFNETETRIFEFDDGSRWFIPAFIKFQYDNKLNPKNRVHYSVINELKKHNLISKYESILSPLLGAKEKEKEKEKGKVKANGRSNPPSLNIPFQEFWELYDKKRGDRCKIGSIWASLTENEREEIFQVLPRYIDSTPDKQFRLDPLKYL